MRLLQIRRLTRLGFSLSVIASMEDESEDLEETLIAVDAELAATITRLKEARREIAKLRRQPALTDLPFDISTAATEARLSRNDRSLFAVLAHVIGDDSSQHWQVSCRTTGKMTRPTSSTRSHRTPTRRHANCSRNAWPRRRARWSKSTRCHQGPSRWQRGPSTTDTLITTMLDLYNPAQLDVIVRIWKTAGLI